MKVALAFCAAWALRFVFAFELADRIEEWAGIDYADESDAEGKKFSEVVREHMAKKRLRYDWSAACWWMSVGVTKDAHWWARCP